VVFWCVRRDSSGKALGVGPSTLVCGTSLEGTARAAKRLLTRSWRELREEIGVKALAFEEIARPGGAAAGFSWRGAVSHVPSYRLGWRPAATGLGTFRAALVGLDHALALPLATLATAIFFRAALERANGRIRTSDLTLERPAGSHALAAAAQRAC